MKDQIITMAKDAKDASREMGKAGSTEKNKTLETMARLLEEKKELLFKENKKDLEYGREKGLSEAMLDRLCITESTLASMAKGLREVVAMKDPIGTMSETRIRPNGLSVAKMRIPLGVVMMIYESRPNVTVDAAGLCLKAGNAVVLRGGSEAMNTNRALAETIQESLKENGLPEKAVQLVNTRDRKAMNLLLEQEENIDLVIPRGGEGLIRFVVENSRIPVLKHYKGVCHIYVDEDADLEMAEELVLNAKTQRPGVCNALETLLVHESIADNFLKKAGKGLVDADVEIRGCKRTLEILNVAVPAKPEDWGCEFLDLILAVKVVKNMEEALDHIAEYGSQHTEAIITRDYRKSKSFVREADASAVMVNASTRFNDGGELGLGAEIGISTSKLHAFGPMSVNELTASKFVVLGDGQIRE